MAITQGSVGAGGGGGGGSVDPTAPNAVELSDGAAYYVAAKDSTLAGVLTTADFDTKVGSLTETAPATDIASSGLNGRLQRVAQRLTSLIALFPTALVSNRLDVNLGAAPAAITLGAGAAAVGTVGVTSSVTPADRTATGAVAATNANVALTPNGCGTVTAAIATNASWNGTVTFQGTTDGTNWQAIPATNLGTGAFGSTYATGNTNALFQLNVAGLSQVRVIALTYSAGSATVTLEGSAGSSCFPGLLDSAGRSQVVGASASGAALAGSPVRQGISDGTNAQDLKQIGTSNGVAATGIPGYALYGYNGATFDPIKSTTTVAGSLLVSAWGSGATVDGQANSVSFPVDQDGNNRIPAPSMLWNGATFDRPRNNSDVTLLASAARTTTQTSADITTYNTLGIVLTTDITAISGGQTITTTINGKDPSSGKYYPILNSTAYAATGTNVLRVVPGLTAGPNLTANDHLPRVIQIVTTLGNGVSTTYGVGYTLLV